jgi:hypothetical protein
VIAFSWTVTLGLRKLDFFARDDNLSLTDGEKALVKLRRVHDLARLFELPAWHPDRMIAAQVVLYVPLWINLAATLRSHLRATHP